MLGSEKNPPSLFSDGIVHSPGVDYIRATTTSLFSPQKPLVASADIQEYHEWILSKACDYFGLLIPDIVIVRAGHYGYKASIPIISGITLYVMPHSVDMGVCVQISGNGMTSLRYAGWTDHEIVSKMYKDNFRFSRIDACIDTYGGYTAQDAINYVEAIDILPGKYKNAVHMMDMVTMARTLYLGVRSSDTFGRIYDKSIYENEAEQRTRYEVEYKRDHASWAAQTIVLQGFKGLCWDMLDFGGLGGVKNFPTPDTLDVEIPMKKGNVSRETSKGAWVRRCIKAIVEGVQDIGMSEFIELANDAAGYTLFDKMRE